MSYADIASIIKSAAIDRIIAKTAAGDDKENPVCEVRSRCSAPPSSYSPAPPSSYSPAATQVTS